MTNFVGQTVGRYRVLEQLGEGGMATVYKAFDTHLERDVAIKIIRTDQFAPAVLEQILKRFELEAKALARLIHPNIVHLNDYGEMNGIPYLVMDYLPGGTLKQRLGKPIPWEEAVRLLLPIARALQFAHSQNIIHRDVKPSNILITQSGEPMLGDFGLVKMLESDATSELTKAGLGVGTPEYMAPEQWTGQVTPRSDIYSLGVVFYEMVTGRKPFRGDTPATILLKQANEPIPKARQYAPDLPERAEKILEKALAKKPENRYSSMANFTASLDQLARGEIVEKIKNVIFGRLVAEKSMEAKTTPESAGPADDRDTLTEAALLSQQGKIVLQPSSAGSEPASDDNTGGIPFRLPIQIWLKGWRKWALAVLVVLLLAGLGWGMVKLFSHPVMNPLPMTTGNNLQNENQTISPTHILNTSLTTVMTPLPTATFLGGGQGRIAFVSKRDGNQEIYLMDTNGSGLVNLTKNPAEDYSPAWSPDGSKIAFVSDRDGNSEIYVMNADGSNIRRLTKNTALDGTPSWSPDGSQIAFNTNRDRDWEVYVMNADGSNQHNITFNNADDYYPDWSPDGRLIAFSSNRVGNDNVYIMNADGSDQHLLSSAISYGFSPKWSPDGKSIAFNTFSDSFHRIAVMNLGSHELHVLTSTNADAWYGTWSPDGSLLAFVYTLDGNQEIYVMNADGSNLRRLTKNDAEDHSPVWQP